MARSPLFRTSRFAYHVTARSNNKEWFYIPQNPCWKILTEKLALATAKYETEIHSFVLMSNHFHMILSTPLENLDRMMRYFMTEANRGIRFESSRINHIFGGRYRWSVLDSAYALAYVFKYVYRNPVRAGICRQVEEYPFSTLNDLSTPLPIVEGILPYWSAIPRDREDRLKWLNGPTQKEAEELVGRALRRFRFQFTTTSGLQKNLRILRTEYLIEA